MKTLFLSFQRRKFSLFTAIILLITIDPLAAKEEVSIHFEKKAVTANALPLGINLGYATFYGAEQFFNNILANPGFEGYLDRALVIVSESKSDSFSEDSEGYPDNLWKGAQFEVRSGANKGHKGTISRSVKKAESQKPEFFTQSPLPNLLKGDLIVLTKVANEGALNAPVPSWWVPKNSEGRVEIARGAPRPNGLGVTSLKLTPKENEPAEIQSYLDTINERAGNLLPVNGKWTLSFWAKSEEDSESTHLNTFFARLNGTPVFFDYEIHPKKDWKFYSFEFDANDSSKPGPLKFQFQANGKVPIFIDDVYLGPHFDAEVFPFRKEVVEMLKFLKPSYLRDHQGQMGDDFANRISERSERLSTSIRAFYGERNLIFNYSLTEFLLLCKQVGCNPWIVCPTGFDDEEAYALGKYLAVEANASLFSNVIVEFGNENWNALFRTLGIPAPELHGKIADEIFNKIKEGANDKVHLTFVVNGQHANPKNAFRFLEMASSADALAVAPYFFPTLENGVSDDEAFLSLFADDPYLKQIEEMVKAENKQLMIYELNLHTDGGSASSNAKNRFITSKVAACALAKKVMEAMNLNIQPQMLFTFSQFDSKNGLKLWGLTRDLGPTKRFRPMGLMMHLFNLAIRGEMYPSISSDNSCHAIAFKHTRGWQAAVISTSNQEKQLQIEFPDSDEPLPDTVLFLSAKSPFSNNEESEEVKIEKLSLTPIKKGVSLTLPAFSVAVLLKEGTYDQ